jgi:hypothetical protein
MPAPDSVTSDIITAATFMAAIILGYLANLNLSFGSLSKEAQSFTVASSRKVAWRAFWGFLFSTLSVGSALLASWLDAPLLLLIAIVLLGVVFAGGVIIAYVMVNEIS